MGHRTAKVESYDCYTMIGGSTAPWITGARNFTGREVDTCQLVSCTTQAALKHPCIGLMRCLAGLTWMTLQSSRMGMLQHAVTI